MATEAINRFLDPAVLAQVGSLDLVARTVVDGFVAGLHRSPDFGFSQEFAEYRAYTPGDDLRHVDWNVYARTEKAYLKRFRGETNTTLNILLDASASMGYGSGSVSKFEYAKFLASALVYLANLQRDSTGLIVFADDVLNFVQPTSRQGQLMRLWHSIDKAELGKRTNFARPFIELQQFLKRRGITVLISDLFEKPDAIIDTVAPLRYRGNELVLFHVLDRQELKPVLAGPALMLDMETGETIEATPDYAHHEYPARVQAHIERLRSASQGAGIGYHLLPTDKPLDEALREYFILREGRL